MKWWQLVDWYPIHQCFCALCAVLDARAGHGDRRAGACDAVRNHGAPRPGATGWSRALSYRRPPHLRMTEIDPEAPGFLDLCRGARGPNWQLLAIGGAAVIVLLNVVELVILVLR